MSYREEDYLQLSGIQHFLFCRRQWALIHIEKQWEENLRTAEGRLMHENAHDGAFRESRGDVIITRAMPIASSRLGLSGECDIVEFHKSKSGISLFGHTGNFNVIPIEYKRGKSKENDCDRLQLAAQAMCLEDMLCCEIPYGYLFYGETRRRQEVSISAELREKVERVVAEMHKLYRDEYTPKGKRTKSCNACSLKHICLPVICSGKTADGYIRSMMEGLS